jgi:hypothetical protein
MNGFHVQGMTEGELDSFFTAKIKKPVPGEHAFYPNYQTFPEGSDDFEEIFRVTADVAMDKDIALSIENTDIHFPGMKIDSAVVFVCFRVKSHKGPLWSIGSR